MLKNSCKFIGRTGDNIEMHHFDNGDCVGRVSIAVDESYKNKEGQKVEQTTWVNLVARNRIARFFEKYVPKGAKVAIETKYNLRSYEDASGNKRYSPEFHVVDVVPMDAKKSSGDQSQQNQSSKPTGINDDDDDDMPF